METKSRVNTVAEQGDISWARSVNTVGRLTLIAAILLSFGPFLYLAVTYDVMPPTFAIIGGIIGVASAFGVVWIVEPMSYFSILGSAGTYMSFLAGSIGQMRVPAAAVAKQVAGVEDNTREAEIVAICGIAGSIYLNLAVVTITAVAGTVILALLPEVVLNAITSYILAAIFGAVLAMFARGRIAVAIPTFAFAIGIHLLLSTGLLPPVFNVFAMLLCVVAGVLVSRLLYTKGLVK